MNGFQPPHSGPSPARRRNRALALAAAAVVLLLVGALAWDSFASRHDRAALRLLQASDPDARRLGAWLAARENAPQALRAIRHALLEPLEPDPAVRESYVYALGRHGTPAEFDAVARVVRSDTDPYVRQAAWLAAARLDPQRFRTLAAQGPSGDDSWDQIGLACAWLEVGDVRGVEALLHWAAAGNPQERHVACLALYRGLAPLLEIVGRWPIQYTVREGAPWSTELVAEVRQRCGELNLQTLAEEARPQALGAAALRREVGRLNSTREYLARFLFAR